MRIINKKNVLGVVAGLILLMGIGYTNCGDSNMLSEDGSSSKSSSIKLTESRLPSGEYSVKFKDGTKVKFKQ